MSAFDLGRMRHLDLLALYHRLHPDSHELNPLWLTAMSKDSLAALILGGAR